MNNTKIIITRIIICLMIITSLFKNDLNNQFLVIFNSLKDLPIAMTPSEIKELLGLKLIYGRNWYLKGTSSLTVEGIEEGILWLSLQLKKLQK